MSARTIGLNFMTELWNCNQYALEFSENLLRYRLLGRRLNELLFFRGRSAADVIQALGHVDTKERERLATSVADIINLLSQAQDRIVRGDHDTEQTAKQLKGATEHLRLTSVTRPSA